MNISAGNFFSQSNNRRQVRELFVKRWEADPNTPLARPTIQKIVDELVPGALIKVHQLDTAAPGLVQEIEAMCRTKGGLPPILRSGGRIVHRDLDGKLITSPPAPPAPKAAPPAPPAPKANGYPPPPLPQTESKRRTKVFWGDEQQEKMAQRMLELWAEDPDLIGTVKLANIAMHDVIPQHEWRPMGSPKQVGPGYAKFLELAKGVIARGLGKIAPIVEIKEITLPCDIDRELDRVSIPKLAGVLARRQAEEQQSYYALMTAGNAAGGVPHVASSAKQALADAGVTEEDVEALLPLVQVIGFTSAQHAGLVDRFKHHPVRFAPSVSPFSPVEPGKLANACTLYIVDASTTPRPWQEMVVAQVPSTDKREKVSSPTRVFDHIKDHFGKWMNRNPAVYAAWKNRSNGAQ